MLYTILGLCSLSIVTAISLGARTIADALDRIAASHRPREVTPSSQPLDYRRLATEIAYAKGGAVR